MLRVILVSSLVWFALTNVANAAENRALSDAEWLADIDQMSTAIKEIHFKPFSEHAEPDFDAAVDDLKSRLTGLKDWEIIMGMARIVSPLRDGHTRVHLPRQYPKFALEAELGHGGTPPPHLDSLKFQQLPVQFGLFSDGVFVTGASEEHSSLVGKQVFRIGNLEIEELVTRTQAVTFFENQSRARMMAPDRLALVEVLANLGAIDEPGPVTITFESDAITLEPLSGDTDSWVDGQPADRPRWTRDIKTDEWFEVVPEDDAIYVQVNRFAENPKRPYSDFVAQTLSAAREAGVSRYIVDLRHNSGGIGSWVIPFTRGITRSEFNQYGRLFILIGGTTFSAAEHFLHAFEEYSYAMFVGEPSGAKPSHYGDARRIVLDNSGVTIRVSTLYWNSWLANDFRDAIQPHLDAPLSSGDFFSGNDPGWQAAVSYTAPDSLAAQMAEQFRAENNQNALLLYQRYMTDPSYTGLRSDIPELSEMADQLVEDGYVRPGMFVYFLMNQTFPGVASIESGLERTQALASQAQE